MTDRHILRIGGIGGILFLILFIPSYLSPPDSPSSGSSTQQLLDHLISRRDEIILLNGVLLVFAAFFFLWFIGILHAVLQGAERDGYGFASVALTGGLLFVALMLTGAAIEIIHPATQSRFANFQRDPQVGFMSYALAGWMYRFAFVGLAVLITATSLVSLRTEVLPRWLAWAGFVCAVVALMRFFGPLGGWLVMAWIAVVCGLMIAGRVGRPALAARP